MKKYTDKTNFKKDIVLARMLRDRRAPLTAEAMNRLLTDLTLYMTGEVQFAAVFYPHSDAGKKEIIHAEDLEKADIMEGNDKERYLPVFTDIDHLKKWKPKMNPGEAVYILDKADILDFLNHNSRIAAAVVNPQEDDLLLYRMQLQNMIRVAAD